MRARRPYHPVGGTDVPITDGGTGSSTAAAARTALGARASDVELVIQVVDGATDTATGDGQAHIAVPEQANGFNLVDVVIQAVVAGVTGTMDVQIHNLTQGADMLSTVATIDTTETSSATAATPVVIDTGNDDVATDDQLRIDVDAVHTTAAKGFLVRLKFSPA